MDTDSKQKTVSKVCSIDTTHLDQFKGFKDLFKVEAFSKIFSGSASDMLGGTLLKNVLGKDVNISNISNIGSVVKNISTQVENNRKEIDNLKTQIITGITNEKNATQQQVKELLVRQSKRAEGKMSWLMNSQKYFKDMMQSVKSCKENFKQSFRTPGQEMTEISTNRAECEKELSSLGVPTNLVDEAVKDSTTNYDILRFL